MIKRILMLACVLAILAPAGDAGVGLVYNSDVSVTQANSAVLFYDNGSAGTAQAFNATQVLVRSLSTSANTCAFDMKDTTAVYATDIKLEPGGSISLTFPSTSVGEVDGWPGMGAICDTGQTATFRVTAMR